MDTASIFWRWSVPGTVCRCSSPGGPSASAGGRFRAHASRCAAPTRRNSSAHVWWSGCCGAKWWTRGPPPVEVPRLRLPTHKPGTAYKIGNDVQSAAARSSTTCVSAGEHAVSLGISTDQTVGGSNPFGLPHLTAEAPGQRSFTPVTTQRSPLGSDHVTNGRVSLRSGSIDEWCPRGRRRRCDRQPRRRPAGGHRFFPPGRRRWAPTAPRFSGSSQPARTQWALSRTRIGPREALLASDQDLGGLDKYDDRVARGQTEPFCRPRR